MVVNVMLVGRVIAVVFPVLQGTMGKIVYNSVPVLRVPLVLVIQSVGNVNANQVLLATSVKMVI